MHRTSANSKLHPTRIGATQLGVCALRFQVHVSGLPLCFWVLPFPLSLFPNAHSHSPIVFVSADLSSLCSFFLSLRVSLRFELFLVPIRVLVVKIAEFRSELVNFRHIQVFHSISYQICNFRLIHIRFAPFDFSN